MSDRRPGSTPPPPRRGGKRPQPSPRAPSRAKKRPARRGPTWKRPVVYVPVVVAIAAAVAVVTLLLTSGGGTTAAGYKVGNLAVYTKSGPEGVPNEAGPVLAKPNPSLSSNPVDGVACGATEQLTVHVHTHLVIFVNGAPRAVPAGVGMVPPISYQQTPNGVFADVTSTCLFWLHTHAQDGIIHVEAPQARQFVLGQFFDIWGQTLNPNQVGPAQGPVTATVDGHPYSGDPREIPLSSHGQIVLNVGKPVVSPPPISFSGTQL